MMVVADDLRLSILQYAIEGKLSKQLEEDTPVEVTLEKLSSIKKHLIQTNTIKKEKPYSGDGTLPFDIPATWRWVRLFDIGELSRGKSKHRPRNDDILYINGTIPLIQTGDVAAAKKYIKSYEKCYNETGLAQSRLWKAGTLCITIAANIGDVAILGFDACFPDSVVGFQPFSEDVSTEYIYYMLLAYKQRMNAKATKVAQSNLSLDKISTLLFPFPPIEEQRRISERLNDLMVQLGEYERVEKRLSELKAAFPTSMRAAVLQAAMQGKLTERVNADAQELLKCITDDKESLQQKRQVKYDKRLFISDEITETPFEIPDNWQWTFLGNILQKLTDGTHNTPKYTASGARFLSVKDMSSGRVDFSNTKFISREEHEELYKRCDPKRGDILLSKVGTTGVPAYVDTDEEFSLFVSVALLRFNHRFIFPQFLYYLICSPLVQWQAIEKTRGVGNQNWVLDKIARTIIVLPPYEEQQRIVERLDKLLPLCDAL